MTAKQDTGTATLPTFAEMYAFLKANYRDARFEGSNAQWPNGVSEGGTYAELLTRSAIERLAKHGVGHLGCYETGGQSIKYDRSLRVISKNG